MSFYMLIKLAIRAINIIMLDTAPLDTNFKMLYYFYGSLSFADTDQNNYSVSSYRII